MSFDRGFLWIGVALIYLPDLPLFPSLAEKQQTDVEDNDHPRSLIQNTHVAFPSRTIARQNYETGITLVIILRQSPGKINGGCHIPVESNSRLHQILCCNWVALDDFYSFFFLHQPTDWLLAAGSVESYGDTSAGMIHDLWRHWTTDYNAALLKWLHWTRITMRLCLNDCIEPGLQCGSA